MQLKFSQIKFLLPSLCLSCSLRCHLKASICRQPSHKLVAKPFDCKTKLIAPYSPTGYLFFEARKTTSAQPGLFSLVTQFSARQQYIPYYGPSIHFVLAQNWTLNSHFENSAPRRFSKSASCSNYQVSRKK